MQKYAYVVLEVGGIQKYILSTGKLKEMIGGSEIIASLGERCREICEQKMLLRKVEEPDAKNSDWYCLLQDSGGAIRLLMAGEDMAKAFLSAISAYAIEHYAGLPLYGTQVSCSWEIASLKEAARAAAQKITQKRNMSTLAPKGLWPFCRAAVLDGLPVVDKDKEEYISAPSKARRQRSLLDAAQERLQELVSLDAPVQWVTDMEELLKKAPVQRIALIHIDGNNLGAAFRKRLEQPSTPVEWVRSLKDLSNLVDSANKAAFAQAVQHVIALDTTYSAGKNTSGEYIVPLRPLVLGGDDLTLIIRADLAFAFIDAYSTAFEQLSQEKGERLSVGAGMVTMQPGYPFARAFHLVEQLTDSAKRMTSSMVPRPSSVDYLVLTNDVIPDLKAHREQVAMAEDAYSLTAKPFFCGNKQPDSADYAGNFHIDAVLKDAYQVAEKLPASHTREAISQCRRGREFGQRAWAKLKENIGRGIGGRKDKECMHMGTFERIFPQSFYCQKPHESKECTLLGDFVELRHLNVFHLVQAQEDKKCKPS